MGSETPETKEFASNVARYQRGEEVLYTIEKEDEKKEDAPSHQVSQGSSTIPSNGTTKNNAMNGNKKEALQARKNQKQQGKRGKVPPPSKKATPPQASGQSSAAAITKLTPLSTPPPSATPEPVTEKPPVQKTIPQRGKAKFVCGCMGNRDKPLTNCLYCGRIVCEREGYGYCPFCGFAIEEVIASAANSNDESWVQKERLLRFDREFARRTKIFDDQADFQGPASWMSEEERAAAEQKQLERLEEMRRPKQILNLNI